jgi:prepilin-type N-terminal cleavage/methylation domain-containing protein
MSMLIRQNKQSAGVTLIELLVALTIASVVCGILFYSFRMLYNDAHIQSRRVESLQKALIIKKKIDRMLDTAGIVTDVSEQMVSFLKHDPVDSVQGDSVATINFRQNALFYNRQKSIDSLGAMRFELAKNLIDKKKYALVWEATTGQGVWIGGACGSR